MSASIPPPGPSKKTEWNWGVELDPPDTYIPPIDNTPTIQGRSVVWITDIRKAPGGDNFSFFGANEIKGSELCLRVMAVATDQFTLYLEEGSLEGFRPTLLGGYHLDASGRKAGVIAEKLDLKFQLPFEKNIYMADKVLRPANECPLSEPPPQPFAVSLVRVEKLQRRNDHHHINAFGFYKDGKIILNLKHSFPVTGFKLEYEAKQFTPGGSPILYAELFAISHHNVQDCTCSRKSEIRSILEFDLVKLGQGIPHIVIIQGLPCHRSGFPDLQINTK